MRRPPIALLAAALLLSACRAAAPPAAAPAEHPLVNTAWRLVDIDARPALAQPSSTLVFESRERVSGQGGCNRYFGTLNLEGGNIVVSGVGSTRMACPPPQMEQEQRFLAALQAVAYWERRDDALLLMDGQGRQRMRLGRLPSTSSGTGSAAPAPAAAVFQGIGHEPGWTLEIRPDAMELVTAYGAQRVSAPTPAPQTGAAGETTYAAATDTHRLAVRIRPEPCRDSMSGLGYPATVEVLLDDTPLRGCGHWSR